MSRWFLFLWIVGLTATTAIGQIPASESVPEGAPATGSSESSTQKAVEYSKNGLDIRSSDGNFAAHINWRAQLRYTTREFDDPLVVNPDDREGDFVVNRARFKLGGHAFRPWLTYDFEYDFVRAALLDLRFSFKASDELQLRVGQWKVPLNRERVDSSGKQQFADRSIVTPWFTLDFSRINDRSAEAGKRYENRVRLQWDVSF